MRAVKGARGGLTGALTRIKGFSANLDWPWAGCYSQFFTDWIKQCSGFAAYDSGGTIQSVPTNSDGWITGGIPAGGHVRFFLYNSLGNAGVNTAFVRPGTYKARLTASFIAAGWTCQFADLLSTGFLSASAAGTTSTMTIADRGSGSYSGMLVILDCFAPGTGGPYSFISGVQAYLQSQEAHLDAGTDAAIFDQDFLNDMVGVRMIRTKDWAGTDIAAYNYTRNDGHQDRRKRGICDSSELAVDTLASWQMPSQAGPTPVMTGPNFAGTGQVPYKIQAKLAKVLAAQNPDGKCALMLHFPLMHNMNPFDVTITGNTFTCYGHDLQNGDKVVLGTNFVPAGFARYTFYYVRDVVANVSWSLADTPGGVAHTVTANESNASTYQCQAYKIYTETQTQALYDAIATIVHTEAPNIDIVSDVGNENWNATQPYGFDQCFSALCMQAGATFNAGIGYAWALMRAWKAVEKLYPRSQHVRMFQGQGVFFNQTGPSGYGYQDATLYDGVKLVDLIDAHCNAPYVYGSLCAGQVKNSNDADIPTFGYALSGTNYQYWTIGQVYNPGDIVHKADGTNYICILQHSSQTPPNGTYWRALNPNGLTSTGDTWSDDQLFEFGLYSNQQSQFYHVFYKAQGDALRTNPVPLGYISYEGGPLLATTGFNIGSNTPAYVTKWLAFMRTQRYQQFIQDYFHTVIKGSGITSVCQYMFAGQWRNDAVSLADSTAYGLKRGHGEPDTFASKWFKTGMSGG